MRLPVMRFFSLFPALEGIFYSKSLIKFAKYTHNTEKICNFVFGF